MKIKILLALILLSTSLLNFAQSGQLVYSTFLGGSGYDFGNAIVIDSVGNAYITGQTSSTDFPTTQGSWDTTSNGNSDVFVTKLNPTGTGLVYSTLFGGGDNDYGQGIAVDLTGNTYITGHTFSLDFPTTQGALDTSYNGISDAFVIKLNPSGSGLVYSTYLGGKSDDYGSCIVVGPSGNAYIAGYTNSTEFPTTPGAYDTTYSVDYGNYDVFVSKLNSTGTGLLYSTYFGSGKDDFVWAIAIDTAGNAYITGNTGDSVFGYSAFVTKINPSGGALVYSYHIGVGLNDAVGHGIALDTAGNAYISGYSNGNFPTTPGAYNTLYNGGIGDIFVCKLNSSGTTLLYSTYLGGNGFDYGDAIAVDSIGNAYIAGYTDSNNFPTTPGAFDSINHNNGDVYVSKLNPTGTSLLYSTLLGGAGIDDCYKIAVDTGGNAYITGYTYSSDFPTTPSAYDTYYNGGTDAFVTKIPTIVPSPPIIKNLPSIKLFTNQSLNPAFDMEDYNTGGTATTYSVVSNFLSLSSLSGSMVYQSEYSSATTGTNTYELESPYGSSTAINKVKYSTYKIKCFPQVVIRPNQSWDVNVGSYTIDSSNTLVIPPSYNQNDSLMVGDTSNINAVWSNPSTITITAIAKFTSVQNVDVIASPQSTAPYGIDIDKERIEVYPALSTTAFEFNNSSDTSLLSYQLPSGITNLATIGYTTTIDDIHGGALQITFSSPSSGVKITPQFSTWLSNTPKNWYTLRVRVFGTNTANSYLQFFFNGDFGKTPMDIQGYYKFSIPTTWTYIDIPMNCYKSVSSAPVMYPQLVLKANGGIGIIYIDEMEIFQATPPLLTSRYKTFDNYVGGSWNNSSATTQWAKEVLSGSGSINVLNSQLYVTTSGGSSTQTYLKFTASTAKNTIYTIPSNLGNQAGMHMSTQLISGTTNISQTMVQVNLLGTRTKGAFVTNGDMASAAEIGRVSNRTLQVAFNANSPFYQVQFIVKNIGISTIQIDNTLADIDNDDPNYGDSTLFP